MMKKLLAMVLSGIMALSLVAPAFAAPEAGSVGVIGGADGPTAIMTSGVLGGSGPLTQELIDQIKEYLGGMPHQMGVMVNGEYVQFPDAIPEIKDGCAMVPIRALAAVLGGQVAYGEEEVEQFEKTDKTCLTFALNSNEVIVDYPSGKGELRTLSCAPYIKDGRAYVPVRFMGEILGYEVGWDSQFQTAILLDREALAAEIDKDFTILNRVRAAAASSMEEGKSCRSDVEGSVTITAFDTLNGDKTYTAELAGETLLNTEAVNGTYSLTLSDNAVDALLELMADANWGETGEDADAADAMRTILENLSMDFIMAGQGLSHDLNAYSAWIHVPVLDELSGEKNVWHHYNLDAAPVQLMLTGTGAATTGEVLASLVRTDSVESWAMVNEAVRQMTAVYGDENFTTSGGTSTLLMDADTLDPTGELGLKDAFAEYQLTMKVDSKGGVTVSCLMESAAQPGMPGVRVAIQSAQSGGKADVTMEIHVSNLCEVKLELTSTQQAADEQPVTEPSGGANIDAGPALLTAGSR